MVLLLGAIGCDSNSGVNSDQPSSTGQPARGEMTDCLSNRAVIAGYALKHKQEKGVYPKTVEEMVPEYLNETPVCPAGGTYKLTAGEGVLEVECSVHGTTTY